MTCSLPIVALPYYEVGECLGEFLAETQGRAMTLRPEPTNDVDALAIRAYDWQGRHVGYVASSDLSVCWQALHGSGRHSLRGHVVAVNAEHKCVVFECHVEVLGEVEELYPIIPYLEWSYTGPVLKPTQEMVTLEYMTDEIDERLDEQERWGDAEHEDFLMLTNRFCSLSKYDLSSEMADYRRRLCLRLMDTKDDSFLPLVDELTLAFGRTGRETHGGAVLDYWMRVLSDSKTVKGLYGCRHDYDESAVRAELERFPEGMYNVWVENRERFVTRLLYLHVPRRVLWQFVSGIAFLELKKTEALLAEKKAVAERKPLNVILTGEHAQYIENGN